MSRWGIVARSLTKGSPWIVLPSAVHVGLEQLAERDLVAARVRDLDADRGLAGDPVDEHRFGLHGEAEIVGQAGDLAVLDARVRLELVGRHHRAGVNLDDRPLDGELAALLLEEPRAVHQLALVDLALATGCVEQRQRRQRVAVLAALGRCVTLRFRERQRSGHREGPLLVDRGRGPRPRARSRRGHNILVVQVLVVEVVVVHGERAAPGGRRGDSRGRRLGPGASLLRLLPDDLLALFLAALLLAALRP
jgi:hypothetical protein